MTHRHNNNNENAPFKKLNLEEKVGFLERTMQFSFSWSQGATFIFLRFLQIPNHLLEWETFVSSISTSPLTTLKKFYKCLTISKFQGTKSKNWPFMLEYTAMWHKQFFNFDVKKFAQQKCSRATFGIWSLVRREVNLRKRKSLWAAGLTRAVRALRLAAVATSVA